MEPTRFVYIRTFTDFKVPLYENGGYGEPIFVKGFTKLVDENGGYAKKRKKVVRELKSTAADDFEM